VEALKYYPLFFGKYEKEKKSASSGSSGDGRNSSVTISTQKEGIYESKDFASLDGTGGIYRNGKPFQYQRAFQEEVQAVRTGGGTAAGSRVQDGEGNI